MNKMSKSLIGIAILGTLSTNAIASDLNIWNWSDYIGSTTVEDFKKASGLKNTNYALFDNNEMVEARLLSGHSGFDAVMMVSYYVPRLAKAGALQKIDKSKIPNWIKLDPIRMEALAKIDPDNNYAYPYTEISVGIGYNQKKIEEIFGKGYEIKSWDFLFNPENASKLKQCGIAVLDSPIEIISTAMHYLGKDPTSEKASDYKEAQELLTKFASNVAYFHSARYINDLASGEICVAIGYSGDILQATERAKNSGKGVEIKYTIPDEGSPYWFDCWTIPTNADHYDAAHTWFNFLMDPAVASSISNETRYILPVKEALGNLDPQLRNNPSVVIPEEKIKKMYFLLPTTSKVSRITNRVWNAMKLNASKYEQEEDEGSGWE